uniref:UxaA family hydrolase n=1 Tax=Pararhizobium sp. IMCC3301 TaxID=3067904 RepID=UPI0027420AFB|nr:UxaA family hydrolase [Pararhizobium sp. IMCC3301]
MTVSAILIHPDDNVACLLRDHLAGECATLPTGPTVALKSDTPMGHKIALVAIAKGTPVIKFGAVIGHATIDILPGQHVHLHNLQGGLR